MVSFKVYIGLYAEAVEHLDFIKFVCNILSCIIPFVISGAEGKKEIDGDERVSFILFWLFLILKYNLHNYQIIMEVKKIFLNFQGSRSIFDCVKIKYFNGTGSVIE